MTDVGKTVTASIFKHRRTTLERIEKYISPIYFTDVNLYGKLYKHKIDINSISHWRLPGLGGSWIPWKFDQIIKEEFSPVKLGFSFGPSWSTHWFKISFKVPDEWKNEEVRLRWKTESEAMVWSENGEPLQGLSTGTDNQLRTDFVLSKSWEPNVNLETYFIEVSCSRMFGVGKGGMINPPDPDVVFNLRMCEICVIDTRVQSLLVDLDVLHSLAEELSEDQRGFEALYAGNQMVNYLIEDKWIEAQNISQDFFSKKPNGSMCHQLALIGNCHIDTAWLWPYSETMRKAARSWSATANLLEEFPDMVFACSQAQQLEWVKSTYPSLYQRLIDLSKKGKFIAVGATWVEMDGLLPSGESFMRQFLYGQKFFTAEFGTPCKEFWLPDTFGYNAQIPQVCKHFGIERFLTQKLSWSLVNKFPHNTFIWEGLDGSKVLAHFPPGDSYEMNVEVKEAIKTETQLKDKGRVNLSAFLYGFGDGGGGPTQEMCMRADRLKNVDGCPRMIHMSPDELFTRLEAQKRNLCTWVGELYLELHNGTYTSQAKTKQLNRQCEVALRDAEMLLSIVATRKLLGPSDVVSLRNQCEKAWKGVLTNQFHDVIPGSSIERVYRDSDRFFIEALAICDVVKKACYGALDTGDYSVLHSPLEVFNSLPWIVRKVMKVEHDLPIHAEDGDVTNWESVGYVPLEILPLSLVKPKIISPTPVSIRSEGDVTILENKFLRVHFTAAGQILKLISKGEKSRDIFSNWKSSDDISTEENVDGNCQKLKKNVYVGNVISMYDDVPLYWDAWDVMDYHMETKKATNDDQNSDSVTTMKVIEAEPHFAQVEWTVKLSSKSVLKQKIGLTSLNPYLTFECEVDWNESHKFLKVEFETGLLCRSAIYDIQFGHIERATHRNTSWDSAKFEVCAHKWACLHEGDVGIAILSESKYGWSAHNGTLALSLLRAPKAPDDTCDMGTHHFSYGVMPFQGSFSQSGVVEAGFEFNIPPLLKYSNQRILSPTSFLKVNGDGIMVEAIKVSEDIPTNIIVRLVEHYGNRSEIQLELSNEFGLTKASQCNGMEVEIDGLKIEDKNGSKIIPLRFLPFEIQTLMLKF